jgi:hypothetical protein
VLPNSGLQQTPALAFARPAQLKPGTFGRTKIDMATVTLAIQARLCGPVSFGTVDVIKAVQAHTGLGLGDAKALVDRCVFDGETVTIPDLSDTSASALVTALRALPDAPPIDVRVA